MESKLIIGLGNPGVKYQYSRHNIGFLTIIFLAERFGFQLKVSSFTKAVMAEGIVDGKRIYLLMPMTFMNNSGEVVQQFLKKKAIDLEDVLVVCDDLNLDFLRIRIRLDGGAGGHNGLRSIIQNVGSQEFARLRMGIDRPDDRDDVVDYVLGNFSEKEKKGLSGFVQEAADCGFLWISEGISQAMDRYNRRK